MSESLYILVGIFIGYGCYYCKTRIDLYLTQRIISNNFKTIFSIYTGAALIIGGVAVAEEFTKNKKKHDQLYTLFNRLHKSNNPA